MQLNPTDCDRQLDNKKTGNRRPVRATDGGGRATEDPITGTGPFDLHDALLVAPFPLTVLIVGVRADPLRKAHIPWVRKANVPPDLRNMGLCCLPGIASVPRERRSQRF